MTRLAWFAGVVSLGLVACLLPSPKYRECWSEPSSSGPQYTEITSGTVVVAWPEGSREFSVTGLEITSDVAREWRAEDGGGTAEADPADAGPDGAADARDAGDAGSFDRVPSVLPPGGPVGEPAGSAQGRVAVIKITSPSAAGVFDLATLDAALIRCANPLQSLEGAGTPTGLHCTSRIWNAPVVEPLIGTYTRLEGSTPTVTVDGHTSGGSVVRIEMTTSSYVPPPQTKCGPGPE